MLHEVSILIPVFNIDAVPLVTALHKQALQLLLRFEIRVYDDASANAELQHANRQALSALPHVVYAEMPANLGRAGVRNKMAADASYDPLLFIDADNILPDNSFLKTYRQVYTGQPVIVGGAIEQLFPPGPELRLRWEYGRKRESRPAKVRSQKPHASFDLNNLLISRELFRKIGLDETIRTYGHEDTAFGEKLEEEGIPILHIDNPVQHTGLEPSELFLKKTGDGIANLWRLYSSNGTGAETSLIKAYLRLKSTGLASVFTGSFGAVKSLVLSNLLGPNPNLRLFDLYKLYVLCAAAAEQK